MRLHLEEHGWKTHAFDLAPPDGSLGLEELALQVDRYANTNLPSKYQLISFSMGGLVSRYYLQRLGGLKRVDKFITLATPHYGTITAYARFNEAARQMRPNSPFLQDLNRDITQLQEISFSSIWTPFDLMIIPANSSHVASANNLQVPVLMHPWMLISPNCWKAIHKILSS